MIIVQYVTYWNINRSPLCQMFNTYSYNLNVIIVIIFDIDIKFPTIGDKKLMIISKVLYKMPYPLLYYVHLQLMMNEM